MDRQTLRDGTPQGDVVAERSDRHSNVGRCGRIGREASAHHSHIWQYAGIEVPGDSRGKVGLASPFI